MSEPLGKFLGWQGAAAGPAWRMAGARLSASTGCWERPAPIAGGPGCEHSRQSKPTEAAYRSWGLPLRSGDTYHLSRNNQRRRAELKKASLENLPYLRCFISPPASSSPYLPFSFPCSAESLGTTWNKLLPICVSFMGLIITAWVRSLTCGIWVTEPLLQPADRMGLAGVSDTCYPMTTSWRVEARWVRQG